MSSSLGVLPRPWSVQPTGPGPLLTTQSLDELVVPEAWAGLGEQFRVDVARDGTLTVGQAGAVIEIRAVAVMPERIPRARGIAPGDETDERFALRTGVDGVTIEAVHPAGARHGLTMVRQLLAAAAGAGTPGQLPGVAVEDGPRFAWRGLTLDVARTFIAPADLLRVVDLTALYRLSVLHLHLTDDEGWRLEIPGLPDLTADGDHYTVGDWHDLVRYAEGRGITVVPEIDLPGHCGALLDAYPELAASGGAWLDPTQPAALEVVDQVLSQVAAMTRGRYVHIGGDEVFAMPEDQFAAAVAHARAVVRAAGREPVGWQEAARAGLGGADVIQHWLVVETDRAVVEAALDPEVLAVMEASLARSGDDLAAAADAGARVISSPAAHAYLDRPYAEPGSAPEQEARRARLGMRAYLPAPVSEAYLWDPDEVSQGPGAALVGGVSAALWSETVADVDDLGFLLLPRLASIAEVAWSGAQDWASHAEALAFQPLLWAAHGWYTWFRSSLVPWKISR